MIDNIYDKTSKIAFNIYGNDFLRYFGEFKEIRDVLETEINTAYGVQRKLDKLIEVDDDTLQDWEFEVKVIGDETLFKIEEYNKLKSAEHGKIVDSIIIYFGNPENCKEEIKIGRSIIFVPIIKYLQKMDLPKRLNTIENKVKNGKKILIEDELTLIFVGLSVKDKYKEKIVKKVCEVLNEIDYIDKSRRISIDSLISFQIENFVKSKKDRDKLNEVVSMSVPFEKVLLEVEREHQFDKGYNKGIEQGMKQGREQGREQSTDRIVLNMLDEAFDDQTILECTECPANHFFELKRKHLSGK